MLIDRPQNGKSMPTIAGRAIKAIMYHLNGTVSEMVLITPLISFSGEPMEKGNYFVREYINSLTLHWIEISRFETIMGSVMSDGTFRPACGPINHVVPLNKVYNEGKRGKWVSPTDHPNHPLYDSQKGGENA